MVEAVENMAQRHGRMLARIAELSLALAERVQTEALAAETPEETARLSHAFGRVAYAIRQCIALEAKLVQDAERLAQAAAVRAEVERAASREQRAGQIRLSLGRVAAAQQVDHFRRERLLRDIDRLVTEGQLFDRFVEAPLDEQITLLCDYLGLAPEDVEDMSPFLAPPANDDPEIEADGLDGPEAFGRGAGRNDVGPDPAWRGGG